MIKTQSELNPDYFPMGSLGEEFTRYIFWRFDTSLEKLTTNRSLEFFLKLLSRYNILSKQSFVRNMARDLSQLRRPPTRFAAKKACPLAKKLVKLDSAVVSMVFQELCHLLAIFLDCSSSPSRSLLISKPTLCKTGFCRLLLSWSRVRKRTSFFFFFGGIHFQNPGKNSEHYTCRPRFLSNCVISLVQQSLSFVEGRGSRVPCQGARVTFFFSKHFFVEKVIIDAINVIKTNKKNLKNKWCVNIF